MCGDCRLRVVFSCGCQLKCPQPVKWVCVGGDFGCRTQSKFASYLAQTRIESDSQDHTGTSGGATKSWLLLNVSSLLMVSIWSLWQSFVIVILLMVQFCIRHLVTSYCD